MSLAIAQDTPLAAGANMIQLAEILQRSNTLRQRRFEMLPLRGPGSAFTETAQGRKPGDATAPEELSDLISSMAVVGLLEPVLAEEIVHEGRAPTIRLVTGERRLGAMRWGAVHLKDNPHFASLAAVVCPGPLSDEERHMWRFVENFAREPLRPGEQAAALMYQRCAVLLGKLLRAGKPVPAEVYAITDSIQRFQALERIRGGDQSCAAPWTEVLGRLGLQLTERKAYELVRAFRELPRELTEEMDEAAIRLNTRIRFAALRRGRQDAAAEIWAALKDTGRLHLLPTAVDIGLEDPDLEPTDVITASEVRQDRANLHRRLKLTRGHEPGDDDQADEDLDDEDAEPLAPAGPAGAERAPAPITEAEPPPAPDRAAAAEPADAAVVRGALDGLRSLLAELRAGRQLARYDEGSLRLALREVDALLTPAAPHTESEFAA